MSLVEIVVSESPEFGGESMDNSNITYNARMDVTEYFVEVLGKLGPGC